MIGFTKVLYIFCDLQISFLKPFVSLPRLKVFSKSTDPFLESLLDETNCITTSRKNGIGVCFNEGQDQMGNWINWL